MAVEFNAEYKDFCLDVGEESSNSNTEAPKGWERLQVNCDFTNGTGLNVNKYEHEWFGGTGFAAAAYGKLRLDANGDPVRDQNGNKIYDKITIAYRGLQPNSIDDISTVLALYGNNELTKGGQFADAQTFYNKVADQYGEGNITTLTGQSLGGALAQYVAGQENKDAYTYNALSVTGSAGTGNIINYVCMNDYASNNGPHIGSTYYILPVPIGSNPLEDSHCNVIWNYDVEEYGEIIDKPDGFTDSQALSLWYYDMKNTGLISAPVCRVGFNPPRKEMLVA